MQVCKAEGEFVATYGDVCVPFRRLPAPHCEALLKDMNSTSPTTTHKLTTEDLTAALQLLANRAAKPRTVEDEWAMLVSQVPAGHAVIAMDGHTVLETVAWPTAKQASDHASTLGNGAFCVTALPYKLWYLGCDTIALSGEYLTLEEAIRAQESVSVMLRVSGPHT